MDLLEWVNRLAACLVLRSDRSNLRPLSGDMVLGGLPQRSRVCAKGVDSGRGWRVKAVGPCTWRREAVNSQCSRPSACLATIAHPALHKQLS